MHIVQMLLAFILPAGLLALILQRARTPALLPTSASATRHRSLRGRQQGGFTLIELLVVIVIVLFVFACIIGLIAFAVMSGTHVH